MAYEQGTATDYVDLLGKLKTFLTKANTLSAVTDPAPANTGNGTVTGVTAEDDAPSETWTLLCTVGGATGTFSVTGSISGAKAAAIVGTPYDNSVVAFTINDGTPDFINGDNFTFTVAMVMGDEKWTTKRHTVDYNSLGDDELIIMGPGSPGDVEDEVFIGVRTYRDETEGYYNWELNGYTGYEAVPDFYNQAGSIAANRDNLPQDLLDDGICEYWFVANGRRVAGSIKVSGIYVPFYLGLALPYGTPNSIPYPLVVGGSAAYGSTDTKRKHSTTDIIHRGFPDPYIASNSPIAMSSLKLLHGSWISFGNYYADAQSNCRLMNCVWPKIYANRGYMTDWPNELFWYGERNIDDSYSVFPLVLAASNPNNNIFGELQGCYAVFGDGVVSEDDIIFGGKTYKVFQNCFRINAYDFWALKLE